MVRCLHFDYLFTDFFAFQNGGEAEWMEGVSDTFVEFTHKLDPRIKQYFPLFRTEVLTK